MLLLDLSRDRETRRRTMRWYQDSRGYDSLFFDGPAGGLLAGVGGKLYSLETGRSDAGGPIQLTWISKFIDQGAPYNQKTYQVLVIDHNTGGSSATVKA